MTEAPERVVVVGASLAGLRAVEAARDSGYHGELVLVGAEHHLPYDRPPLSKEFLAGADDDPPPLIGADELVSLHGVDLRLGCAATALDMSQQVVRTVGGDIHYDRLLVCTGVTARTLAGADSLGGVHTLRTHADAVAVRRALDAGGRVVVVGAGFIGSEVASEARRRGLAVTVLEGAGTPLVRAVGELAGAGLSALHARHGTDLRCGVAVAGLEGVDHVTGVRLTSGEVVPADLVVVGIGASPATSWLEGSGLALDDGVVCSSVLRAAGNVWAAGDVARWRHPDLGRLIRLEHWTNAVEQAAHAMTNLLDPEHATPYRAMPYFWSDWYGNRIQFTGVADGEPVLVTGSWEDVSFVALFRSEDRLAGALTLNRRADIMKYRMLLARRATWDQALDLAARRNEIAPV